MERADGKGEVGALPGFAFTAAALGMGLGRFLYPLNRPDDGGGIKLKRRAFCGVGSLHKAGDGGGIKLKRRVSGAVGSLDRAGDGGGIKLKRRVFDVTGCG